MCPLLVEVAIFDFVFVGMVVGFVFLVILYVDLVDFHAVIGFGGDD